MEKQRLRVWVGCFAAVVAVALLVGSFDKDVAAVAQDPRGDVIPLDGLDPVLLTQGKEMPGKPALAVTRGQYKYLFAGDETKALFEKDPERYEIQLGGTCARMGPQVGSNPDLFAVYKGRIYVFGSDECQRLFQATPEKYLEPTAAELAASPEARKEGQSLIERAVAAAGGSGKIDGLTSYQETVLTTTRTPQGDSQYRTVTVRVFPDSVRREQARSFGTIITVVAPAGAFTVFQSDTRSNLRPIGDFQRADLEKQLKRDIIQVLRARRQPDFKVAVVAGSKSGDGAPRQLDVGFASVRLRLGVDPSTGRILTMSYVGRNPGNGEIGEIVQTFSDFRDVSGLSLPFKVTGTFNGAADSQQNYTVETISVNGKVDPALFEKPKP
ncbi:MAG TPA: hypothetical protein VFV34_05255 [Blastocatellia bacterium]|nr:hypothetical protein [Blastocatellia bacterium]